MCSGKWIFSRLAPGAAVRAAVLSRAQGIAQAMRKAPHPGGHVDSRCPRFLRSLNPLPLLIYNYLLNSMSQHCFGRQMVWWEILLHFRERDGKLSPPGRNRDVGLEPQLQLNIYTTCGSISFRFPCGAISMLMNPRNNSRIKTHFLSKNRPNIRTLKKAVWHLLIQTLYSWKGSTWFVACSFSSFSTNLFHEVMGLKKKKKKIGISDNNSKYLAYFEINGVWEPCLIRLRHLSSTAQVLRSLCCISCHTQGSVTLVKQFSFTEIWYFMESLKQQESPTSAGNGFRKTKLLCQGFSWYELNNVYHGEKKCTWKLKQIELKKISCLRYWNLWDRRERLSLLWTARDCSQALPERGNSASLCPAWSWWFVGGRAGRWDLSPLHLCQL